MNEAVPESSWVTSAGDSAPAPSVREAAESSGREWNIHPERAQVALALRCVLESHRPDPELLGGVQILLHIIDEDCLARTQRIRLQQVLVNRGFRLAKLQPA